MALATKLKELRIRNRQSLQQVADGVGTSKTHIWDMEQGNSGNPSRGLLEKIATHFRVSVSELIGEDPNATGEPSELVALYRDLKKLSPDDIRTIEAVMKSLKDRPRS
ncbi:Helix-turn-helix domain-containing protein [Rhizobiales bacterium GAS113]|nr:Helix-turn-helix domain-containing protein [Rhizobiales bacterium GAS113]